MKPVDRVRIKAPRAFAHLTEIDVRTGDINYGGHVGHDRFLLLAQEARARFLESLGFSELDIDGFGIIVRDAAAVYKREVFRGQVLKVHSVVVNLRENTCDFVHRFTETASGAEVAMLKIGAVFFDYRIRKTAPAPEKFRRAVEGPC